MPDHSDDGNQRHVKKEKKKESNAHPESPAQCGREAGQAYHYDERRKCGVKQHPRFPCSAFEPARQSLLTFIDRKLEVEPKISYLLVSVFRKGARLAPKEGWGGSVSFLIDHV